MHLTQEDIFCKEKDFKRRDECEEFLKIAWLQRPSQKVEEKMQSGVMVSGLRVILNLMKIQKRKRKRTLKKVVVRNRRISKR